MAWDIPDKSKALATSPGPHLPRPSKVWAVDAFRKMLSPDKMVQNQSSGVEYQTNKQTKMLMRSTGFCCMTCVGFYCQQCCHLPEEPGNSRVLPQAVGTERAAVDTATASALTPFNV